MRQITEDGRSARWADHRAARRDELVIAARRAVHHHGPDVSMDEIAAFAGTSKSIVYRYFADKTGLQIAVGEKVVDEMHAALEDAVSSAATPREGLRAMVEVYLEMVEASPNVYYFVTRPSSEDASAPVGHFLDAVTELIAAPFARVLTDTVADTVAEAWAAGAVGFVRGVGEWWLAQPETDSAAAAAARALDRETLTGHVASWLWAGPVGMLARERGSVTVDVTADVTADPSLVNADLRETP